MASRPVLYRGGQVLTQDPMLGDLTGDVLLIENRIAEVGHNLAAPADAEVIDADGLVLLPGFVDTHRHTWETTLRGTTAWQDYDTYARMIRHEFGGLIQPDDVYAGDLLGMVGALESGITTVRDESHVQNNPEFTEAVLQGLVDSGGRAVFAYGWPSIDTYTWRSQENPRRHPTYIETLLRRGNPAGDGLVSFALMLRGPELSGIAIAQDDIHYARELGLRASMHIGGVVSSQLRGVEALQNRGLLGPDMLFIHCSTTSDEELRMIGDSGAAASVAAYIELAMPGIGAPATSRLVAAGVRPSLSIDAEPSSPTDMFNVMRAVLLAECASRVFTSNEPPVTLTERDVLSFATIEGARACGLDRHIGSLSPGKLADLIVMDSRQPGTSAVVDAASAVVNHGHAGAVLDVLVAGRYVKRDGRMVDQGLVSRAVRGAEASRDRLLDVHRQKFVEPDRSD